MRKILLNPAKSKHFKLDTTPFFSILNKNHPSLRSSALKLLKPSKTYLHRIALKQSIFQIKANFKTPDIETNELVNDSEYLQRIEMLWGDSAEWL